MHGPGLKYTIDGKQYDRMRLLPGLLSLPGFDFKEPDSGLPLKLRHVRGRG